MAPAQRRPRRRRRRKHARRAPAPPRSARPRRAAGTSPSLPASPEAAASPSLGVVPSAAERRLLEMARAIAALAAQPGAVPAALRALAEAYAPDGALPGALFAAWGASREDKTAALSLAWAREQVRLALQEAIERGPRLPPRRPPAPDTLAWLLLAGAEAICQEPPSAAADRLRALLDLAGHGETGTPSPPLRPGDLR